MATLTEYNAAIGEGLKALRRQAGLSKAKVAEKLGIGPGWIELFESGDPPKMAVLISLINEYGGSGTSFFAQLPPLDDLREAKSITAQASGENLLLRFPYARFDAQYLLPKASLDEYDRVVSRLVETLPINKRQAVVDAFTEAVQLWPHANPSDLWWFAIQRLYEERLHHPAKDCRLDLAQSWKRTSGWALESVLVSHYHSHLLGRGVRIKIATRDERAKIVHDLKIADRLEADKIDVVLHGKQGSKWLFFGVVHVKASFAERRTDDIHMSTLLKSAGYTTPLCTMDCKSSPAEYPINRGELGTAQGARSAKRKDIEDEGYFTRCFSYNRNTVASPVTLPADRRIYKCDFSNPNDAFSKFIVQRWRAFMA